MNDTAQDMRKWQLVDKTTRDAGRPLYEETTNTYIAPALLRTRTSYSGNRLQRATISWQTYDEVFLIKTDEEVTCEDGERVVNVKVTTITSDYRGCINGHPRLIAVEVEPGTWHANLRPFPLY